MSCHFEGYFLETRVLRSAGVDNHFFLVFLVKNCKSSLLIVSLSLSLRE